MASTLTYADKHLYPFLSINDSALFFLELHRLGEVFGVKIRSERRSQVHSLLDFAPLDDQPWAIVNDDGLAVAAEGLQNL